MKEAMKRLLCKRIAIIGAGPSGLAAAKYLVAEKVFDVIDMYEQRAEVGGLWIHTHDLASDELFQVPQTNPFASLEKPVWRHQNSRWDTEMFKLENLNPLTTEKALVPEFLSPIYDTLETNIPRSLMRYSDHPFSDDTQLFPTHQNVQEYLISYSSEVRHLVKFSTQVKEVRLLHTNDLNHNAECGDRSTSDSWVVTSTFLPSNETSTAIYDAVIIANGHYSVPFIPSIQGMSEWDQAFPGSISHAKYYRRPEQFKGKKVIVVGNSASGLDIGTQIIRHCRSPLLISSKSTSYLASGFPGLTNKIDVPPITSFDASTKIIHFADGRAEIDVDAVVFCTGYFYSFPFLPSTLTRHSNYPLIKTGVRVCNTYKHLLYTPHPSLAFLTLAQKIIPFPVAEAQGAVLARVYAGRLALPSKEKMEEWETHTLANLGPKDERDFHTLNFPKDAEYINDLFDWAVSADGEVEHGAGKQGQAAKEHKGKVPPKWGPWHYWARERFPQIRRAFVELGNERWKAKTLEDVGFDFAAHLNQNGGGKGESCKLS